MISQSDGQVIIVEGLLASIDLGLDSYLLIMSQEIGELSVAGSVATGGPKACDQAG